ncbi:MAG TPA: zinc dependent phospholipase C family protein [Chitinophagaceae bacterium]|nr:zinc dependent phospholipase C family protein [Chitinophagaceae bacterium]
MKKALALFLLLLNYHSSYCWGFYAHQKINYFAVFLLPPQMILLYKQHLAFLSEHAVDPDKRRYIVPQEGPRHFIDIDRYGKHPYPDLPRKWQEAVVKYSEDTLNAHGIVPWWIQIMQQRLTKAFREKDKAKILKLSAELGHYIADAHVPLHVCSNHNGQLTGQKGIHGFWESRIPELLAEKKWDFFIGKAAYITDPAQYIWDRILESGAAADTVLSYEKELSARYPSDRKYAFENRKDVIIRQYSSGYAIAYNDMLKGMVERRMRLSAWSIASFWYTAWVNAGQPELKELLDQSFTDGSKKDYETLNKEWKRNAAKERDCE